MGSDEAHFYNNCQYSGTSGASVPIIDICIIFYVAMILCACLHSLSACPHSFCACRQRNSSKRLMPTHVGFTGEEFAALLRNKMSTNPGAPSIWKPAPAPSFNNTFQFQVSPGNLASCWPQEASGGRVCDRADSTRWVPNHQPNGLAARPINTTWASVAQIVNLPPCLLVFNRLSIRLPCSWLLPNNRFQE